VLGVLLAVFSAAIFAFNNASARRGVLTGSVLQGLAINVPIGVPLFFVAALVTGALPSMARLPAQSVILLAVAGVLHFVLGRYCNFSASRAIGNVLAGPIIQLQLAVSVALAVAVLHEQMTVLRLLGITLLILAPGLMRSAETPSAERAAESGISPFVPRYLEGYAFALLAALAYGITPVLVRLAIIGDDPRSGLMGGMIAYVAAAVTVGLLLVPPRQLRHALAVTPEARKWFAFSGLAVCLAQMCMFVAYTVAPISVVTPIQQLTIAFRVMFARILTPWHEVFGTAMIVGTGLSLLGAVALSLDMEFLLGLVAPPDALTRLLTWRWP
jgi:drug/metabolite transporter (DMT)-like permease